MSTRMKLPKFYKLVQIGALIGVVYACIMGGFIIANTFKLFEHGFMLGFLGVSGGLAYILGAFVVYGIVDCFLASVKAQVESRNELLKLSSFLLENKT